MCFHLKQQRRLCLDRSLPISTGREPLRMLPATLLLPSPLPRRQLNSLVLVTTASRVNLLE